MNKIIDFGAQKVNKFYENPCFFYENFVCGGVKCHPEVVKTCGKLPKCELNIYLAITKRYNTPRFLKKKLWKIK